MESSKVGTEMEEIEDTVECFGNYGVYSRCEKCRFRQVCKRFTFNEKETSIRNGGKYKGRGKERRRPKY